MATSPPVIEVRHWEIIADDLSKAGWSWGCATNVDRDERTIFVTDAHREGKRFVVRADEKLTTSQSRIVGSPNNIDTVCRGLAKLHSR